MARSSFVRSRFLAWGLAALLFSVVGASANDFGGRGEWKSLRAEGLKGTWTVSLEKNGPYVTGMVALSGSNVFEQGTISGTIDGPNIILGVMQEGSRVASFTGTLTNDRIQGNWQSDALGDYGEWFGSLDASLLD